MRSLVTFIFTASILSLPCKKFCTNFHSQKILFIFDASGSMWGKIDKSTKIQVAKETMGKLSEKISDDTHVGLIAYGHNSASDCNDIETLVPLGAFDKTKFNSNM